MPQATTDPFPVGGELPIAIQILIERKGLDPSAVTAREAIRGLLGFGARLEALRRRRILELALLPAEGANVVADLERYFDRTVVLWNSNKERMWVRGAGLRTPWGGEFSHGTTRPGPFGHPPLDRPDRDHLMVWPRDTQGAPEDLAVALAPHRLLGVGAAELWTVEWSDACAEEERQTRIVRVGPIRTRTEGLLANPHYQDHRIFVGAVPLPLWGGAL